MEWNDILPWRGKFSKNQRQVIYLDESYTHAKYTMNKCWQDYSVDDVLKSKTIGKRWITVHTGSEKSFVPGLPLMFISNQSNKKLSQCA